MDEASTSYMLHVMARDMTSTVWRENTDRKKVSFRSIVLEVILRLVV